MPARGPRPGGYSRPKSDLRDCEAEMCEARYMNHEDVTANQKQGGLATAPSARELHTTCPLNHTTAKPVIRDGVLLVGLIDSAARESQNPTAAHSKAKRHDTTQPEGEVR